MNEDYQQLVSQKPGQHLTLSEIALSLNATLDLPTLLKYTVNAASVLVDSEGAFILLPDDAQRALVLAEHYTVLKDNYLPPFQVEVRGSPAGHVLKSGEHYLVENKAQLEIVVGKRAETLLYMPMFSRKEVIGVLAVYNLSEPTTFSRHEMRLLRQLASHAGVAIENARIHAESEARSFDLAVLIDAAEAVNSTLSLSHVLSVIGKNLLKALRCNWAEVVIRSEDASESLTLSAQRSAVWPADHTFCLPLVELPHLAHAVQQAQPLVLGLAEADDTERKLLDGVDHCLLVPFYQQDHFQGVLRLAYLEALPKEISDPLFFANLQKLGHDIAYEVEEGKHSRAVHFARQAARTASADGCSLWLSDGDQASPLLRQVLDDSDLVWKKTPYLRRNLRHFPTLHTAFVRQHMSSYALTDPDLPADIKLLMDEAHLKVLLIVPFVIQDEDKGLVLIADTLRDHRFERREMNLATMLVLQAANALKNARLFEDLQRSLEELRQTNVRLVQSARLSAIGTLAAAVAHQINNPLTTILGDAQLMLADMPYGDSRRESLEAIYRAGRRAHEVVHRLLSMASQQPSEVPPSLMDINATIANTLSLVRVTLYNNRIQLELDLADNLPQAYGIAGQLEDVWLNLLLNARDALRSSEKPLIGIRSVYNRQHNTVEVSVWDNGPGLGNVDPTQLFKAFYTTKPAGEGTGLGLYICASVVERCGGTITTGTSSYGGALFTVSLPCQSR